MKRTIYLLLVALFMIPSFGNLLAQDQNIYPYLKGAVPEVNGKIVFSKTFEAPNVSIDSLMSFTETWINNRNNENELRSSRVLISDEENHTVVGGCEEKLVFKSTALYIDRADIKYYINAVCKNGSVEFEIIRIRYEYEKETSLAENVISDEVSLTKDQTNIEKKAYRWRVKTIDLVNSVFKEYGDYLNWKIKSLS